VLWNLTKFKLFVLRVRCLVHASCAARTPPGLRLCLCDGRLRYTVAFLFVPSELRLWVALSSPTCCLSQAMLRVCHLRILGYHMAASTANTSSFSYDSAGATFLGPVASTTATATAAPPPPAAAFANGLSISAAVNKSASAAMLVSLGHQLCCPHTA